MHSHKLNLFKRYISSYDWDNTVITSTTSKETSDFESIFANETECTNGHDCWNAVSTLNFFQVGYFFFFNQDLEAWKIHGKTFPFSSFKPLMHNVPKWSDTL